MIHWIRYSLLNQQFHSILFHFCVFHRQDGPQVSFVSVSLGPRLFEAKVPECLGRLWWLMFSEGPTSRWKWKETYKEAFLDDHSHRMHGSMGSRWTR